MRKFTKYPSEPIKASSDNSPFTRVKIYDDSFHGDDWYTGQSYAVEDYLYDVVHEIDGDYQIIDASNEVETPEGDLYEGYVIADVSNSIVDFMEQTGIHFEIVE